jgi:hypothetical protein
MGPVGGHEAVVGLGVYGVGPSSIFSVTWGMVIIMLLL